MRYINFPRASKADRLRNVLKGMANIKYAILHLELAERDVPQDIRNCLIEAHKWLNEEIVPALGGETQKRSRAA